MQIQTSRKPFIVSVMSTKGGVTKSTNVANIGAFCADHGLKVLMIDTDTQPTLSSYYHLVQQAPYGLYEFVMRNDVAFQQLISYTEYENLHIIQSNDPLDRLTSDLSKNSAGALFFRTRIQQLCQSTDYDLIIIDTRGTRGVTVDMAVLSSDLVLSPIKPELVSAREFLRGTISLYEDLSLFTQFGLSLPPLKAVINCLDKTKDAKEVVDLLYNIFSDLNKDNIDLLNIEIPNRVAYREAASQSKPVHRHSAEQAEVIFKLCSVLFPQWSEHFAK
ncbi:TPA: ParA family protein [Mannheimia haemolytica]